MQFYSYLWLRQNGVPYYAGKGQGNRAFSSRAHTIHRPKNRTEILVFHHSTEAEAFESEKAFIKWFGRKDLGTGCLRNLTDGGDGPSGHIHSQQQKNKIRRSLKGNQRARGHHWVLSAETKARMSISSKTRMYRKGFHLTAEHKAKIGIASRRQVMSPSARAKLSIIAFAREAAKRANS